jgi:hypothetical protein
MTPDNRGIDSRRRSTQNLIGDLASRGTARALFHASAWASCAFSTDEPFDWVGQRVLRRLGLVPRKKVERNIRVPAVPEEPPPDTPAAAVPAVPVVFVPPSPPTPGEPLAQRGTKVRKLGRAIYKFANIEYIFYKILIWNKNSPRTTRLRAAVLVALACLSPAARAASGETVNLTWETPSQADCPEVADVLGEIRRYVGDDPTRAPIEARATVRSIAQGRWELVLKTKDGVDEGERALQGESCRAVADAAVVVLAWMVDPGAMAKRLVPAAPEKPAPPPPPAAQSPSPAPAPTRALHPRAFLGVGMVADVGTLPFPALGVEAVGGAALGRWWLAAHAAYWPSRSKTSATLSDGRAAGATFTLRLLGIEACLRPLPGPPRFEPWLCVGPEVDQVRGVGFGVNNAGAGSKTWLSLTAALGGGVSLSAGARLVLSIAGVYPTEREHFSLHGVGEVYRPSALAGRASAGLELEL